jgi:hypothetical protein
MMSIDEQYEELMNDPQVSDEEIAEFEQRYYRNRRPPRPPLRKKSGSNIVAFLLLVLVAVIAAGVGVFVWSSKTPSGTVTTNPTADAMNTEASVILTQVVSGSSAIMAESTQQPVSQDAAVIYEPASVSVLPSPVCVDHFVEKKDCNADGTCYFIMSDNGGVQIPAGKQYIDNLTIGQRVAQTCK